ncbi:MAG: hypothetical protein HY868_17075 [Chloroflexi bacterium]|nr:hypothetical protein [Chloroflexota bacterium]
MNNRTRALAILNYESYDRLPIVHFGYWRELLARWAEEGHLTQDEATNWADGNLIDQTISRRLGFDFNWGANFNWKTRLFPPIESKIVEERADGSYIFLDEDGGLVIKKRGVVSIPTEVDHLLKSRQEWDAIFKSRLQFDMARINGTLVHFGEKSLRFDNGGCDALRSTERANPYGLYCGSLLGVIRDWLGLVGMSYLMADDPALFDEIIVTVSDLCYQGVRAILETGARFDYAHFWEDICYNSGPLINPRVFAKKIGPHYKRLTDLVAQYDIHNVSLDCDGKIDALIPTWLENGVNTMFPIEVGTWNASIQPWRAQYGRALRGVGGMNKNVFARDYAAMDAEIERLRPLVDLGGYIPCPDHRIPGDARWENVQYYCEKMRRVFG